MSGLIDQWAYFSRIVYKCNETQVNEYSGILWWLTIGKSAKHITWSNSLVVKDWKGADRREGLLVKFRQKDWDNS